ncbi:hypothetical protein NBRC110019_11690 [Neptunitalea chrysea]|uniref:Thioredoxin domain-containing protein n=1 Tax=Neptunitalea chrysea TaxID=1647581 RepID=A0A9W6ETK6_9FLAO|nr:thioredoxin family protein [Neptunitalea chrysea]GLB52130.1 hypothetical protein NBRC110019_11690 [Neptunitalea chrysea]
MKIFKILSVISIAILAMAFVPSTILNKNKVAKGYVIGDSIKDFTLKNVDNKEVSFSDYASKKGVIVIFTCNSCPFAKAYESRIMDLDKKYAAKGVPVIAINPNNPTIKPEDSFENMQKRAKAKGYTFPYLFDAKQTVYPVFGATKTPHVFLIQNTKKGGVVKYIGAIDDNAFDATQVKVKYLENAVDAMLQGKEIETKTTKAIGCSIKA